ncbi:hypothetical protein CFN58_12300 [Pseudomonas avellanae]|uniref:Uncharacterized protein n=2 Tax=Pseudomonas syringae group TaxID=136849 RepID=A0A261WJN9_9PSED|nr:hypothetical protein CT122_02025 [Pseudomonas syringae pv. actinidiae]OZI86414.1 hypothetical protein CFN58_12300 [Pseudomonas avellanae]PIN63052.1 hypothetical protein CUB86_01965 [Pseudomonas syringae pv. actinidiae]
MITTENQASALKASGPDDASLVRAKGCEAILKQTTLILPDALCVPVLLPVPGRSRTSPLPQKTTVRGQTKRRLVHHTSPVLGAFQCLCLTTWAQPWEMVLAITSTVASTCSR